MARSEIGLERLGESEGRLITLPHMEVLGFARTNCGVLRRKLGT